MKRRKMMPTAADSTGLMYAPEQGCQPPGPSLLRPPWITDEDIVDTRRVWSPYYGRELTDGEAVEILRNVTDLARFLVKARRSDT